MKFINALGLPKTDSLVFFWLSIMLMIVIATLSVWSKWYKKDNKYFLKHRDLYYTISSIFIALFISELLYVTTYSGDLIWFLRPSVVGWIVTIINFVIYFFVAFFQSLAFMMLLYASNTIGHRWVDYQPGLICWAGAVVIIVLGGWFIKGLDVIVVILLVIAQVIQVYTIFRDNNKHRGDEEDLPFTLAYYLIGGLATSSIIGIYLGLFVMVAIALGLFMGACAGGGSGNPLGSDSCTKPDYEPWRVGSDKLQTIDGLKKGYWSKGKFVSNDGEIYSSNGNRTHYL